MPKPLLLDAFLPAPIARSRRLDLFFVLAFFDVTPLSSAAFFPAASALSRKLLPPELEETLTSLFFAASLPAATTLSKKLLPPVFAEPPPIPLFAAPTA